MKRVSWTGGSCPNNFTILRRILLFETTDNSCEFLDILVSPINAHCKFFIVKDCRNLRFFPVTDRPTSHFFPRNRLINIAFFSRDWLTSFTLFSVTYWGIYVSVCNRLMKFTVIYLQNFMIFSCDQQMKLTILFCYRLTNFMIFFSDRLMNLEIFYQDQSTNFTIFFPWQFDKIHDFFFSAIN